MSESLQFERAEFSAESPARVVCATCKDVVQSYYALGGLVVCAQCREDREHSLEGFGLGRFLRAALAGFVAGIAGAALWWGVRAVTDYELGIIAIAVGVAVGKAVSWGSRGKGGWLYQLLALALTYTAVVMNYIPDIVTAMTEGAAGPVPAAVYILAFVFSFSVPFLDVGGNIIGLVIIAIALYEAWKLNKRVEAEMTGPYAVAPAAVPAPVPNV